MPKIVIAVSGGIAAYKVADIISALITQGNEVKVIATDNALNFVTPHVLNVISRSNYVTETPSETKHIELAKWADAFVIVPATANTIAKIANGMADNLVTTTYLALHKDTIRIICPAMNTHMWENNVTVENIATLTIRDEIYVIQPVSGLLACGDIGMGKLAPTKSVVEQISDIVNDFPIWRFPFPYWYTRMGATNDSYSFLDIDWETSIEIPVGSHVGAFGVRRRHDIHKGIDLYAQVGAIVKAVEDGVIVDICPFTGKVAGFPWWENTYAVYVKGKSGIVVYGEIEPYPCLEIGDRISNFDNVGEVLRVLTKDNGRPTSMLHLELHDHDHIHTEQWEIGKPRPIGVLDPTPYLLKAEKER